MLTEDPDSRMYKRIFSEFNASVFGTAPTLKDNLIIDDGDYDSEVERFKRDTRADSPVEDIADVGTDNAPSVLSSLTPPLQSEHHVSVSVTSHVSHTVAGSSQVSNIVNSTVTLPLEQESVESSPIQTTPPVQTLTRPRPTKKKGTKSSKSAAKTPDPNTDEVVPATRSRRAVTTKQTDTTLAEPTTGRTLRNRS